MVTIQRCCFVSRLPSYQMACSHSGRNPRLLRNNLSLSFLLSAVMLESCTNSQTPDAKAVIDGDQMLSSALDEHSAF